MLTLRAEQHRRKWLEGLQWHHTTVRKWVLPAHLLGYRLLEVFNTRRAHGAC